MNAIQYQCSLGVETNYYRDENFINIWNNLNIKNDFVARLKKYNPIITILACTRGDKKRSFNKINTAEEEIDYLEKDKDFKNKMTIRNMVINRVFENKKIQEVYKMDHPSSWIKKENEEVTDVEKIDRN